MVCAREEGAVAFVEEWLDETPSSFVLADILL